jgi:hypothetical protein
MTAVPIVAFAAENPDMVTATRETAVRGSSDFAPTQSQLYELGFVALIGLATLGVQALVLFRNRAPVSDATRIITLAVGTVVMGYDEKQIAPVLGLFGSIAGYLLGRGERAEERRSEQGPKEPGQ